MVVDEDGASPFEIEIYNASLVRTGWVSDPISLAVTVRHNVLSTADLTVGLDHPKLPQLMVEGARLLIRYQGEHLTSGPIRLLTAEGPTQDATATFTIEDDFRLLSRILAWPVPTAAITAQGTRDDTRTGPAETVVKQFLTANINRLGLPITVPASAGRGPTVNVSMRMDIPADKLIAVLDAAGLGISVRQTTTGLVADVYQPATFPHDLSEEAGTLTKWKLTRAAPTATRTVVGGEGEGTSREFRVVADTALEATWGDVIETFTDARDLFTAAQLDAQGAVALAENTVKSGISVELSENNIFRYGPGGVRRGDLVTVSMRSITVTDTLREATLLWNGDDGVLVQPHAGGYDDDPDRALAMKVALALRGQRKLQNR